MAEIEGGQHIHYKHSPFTLEHDGVSVTCDENGHITLKKDNPEDPEAYDEIQCTAALIRLINDMLFRTRKKKFASEPFRKKA